MLLLLAGGGPPHALHHGLACLVCGQPGSLARHVRAHVEVRAGSHEDRDDQPQERPVPPGARGYENDVEQPGVQHGADGRKRPDEQVRHRSPHENSASRGSSWDCFCSSSSSSRSRFFSFFGTSTLTRASRSPRPEPFSFGAPLPFTRSSVPSCVPGFTFTETGRSGVGTSTVAPSAASPLPFRRMRVPSLTPAGILTV